MSRRFFLVGIAVIIRPGSVVQLTIATLFTTIYLILQLQVSPYANVSDNFVALSASFSLHILLFSCVILKVGVLTELEEVRRRL